MDRFEQELIYYLEKYDINGDNPATFKAVREWKDSF